MRPAEPWKGRGLRVTARGPGICDRCGLHATMRSLDVAVPAIPERRSQLRDGHTMPGAPAGWCPLIALCGMCWTDVRDMLRAKATPDPSGEVSP